LRSGRGVHADEGCDPLEVRRQLETETAMRRRDFFKTLPAVAGLTLALPNAARAAKVKITDVRLINIRLIKDMGIVPRRVGAGNAGGLPIKIGGFSVTEVHTDQGLIGIGPGIDPSFIRKRRTSSSGRIPLISI